MTKKNILTATKKDHLLNQNEGQLPNVSANTLHLKQYIMIPKCVVLKDIDPLLTRGPSDKEHI